MRGILAFCALPLVALAGFSSVYFLQGANAVALTGDPACSQSVSEALLSNRITAPSQSYRRDNPAEYAKVRTYLTGGARPTGVTTHMGLHLVLLEDVCRAPDVTTTTSTTTQPTTTTTTTTQPTTTTTTTTTTPQTCTNAFASPGSCGYPDPAYGNVGVPSGTSLTPSGSINVTVAGTVIDGRDVMGEINVNANNVTIRNTRITKTSGGCGSTTCGNSVIGIGGAYTVTISHVEIRTGPGVNVEHGIRNSHGGQINVDHVLQATDIDALCWCGNANLQDNYSFIHLGIPGDHLENLYYDGHTVVANHNTFINNQPQTSNSFGNVNNGSDGPCQNKLTFTNNLLAGGGQSITVCAHGTSQGTSTTTITGNRFSRCITKPEVPGGGGTWFCPGGPDAWGYFPRSGSFHVQTSVYPNMIWRDNYWNDNLQRFCPDMNPGCP